VLLRTLTLGTILFATLSTRTVSAQHVPISSDLPIPQPINAYPFQQSAPPAGDALIPAVSGPVSTDATRDQQRLLLQQKSAELDRLQREVAQLRAATGTPQQILVKIQMLEVSLTKLRKLGVDFAHAAPYEGVFGSSPASLLANISNPGGSHSAVRITGGDTFEFGIVDAKSAFSGWLDALERNNIAKILAEPNLVVVSGRPGSFNVGGEFPLPANNDSKAVVDFRKFGTQVDVLASALGGNQVRLEFKARVCEIDDNHAVEVNGFRIPRLNVRECDTATQMAFGQTAVLSGLVQQRTESHTVEGGQTKEERVDVALMVIVTPEYVAPLDAPAVSAHRDMKSATKK